MKITLRQILPVVVVLLALTKYACVKVLHKEFVNPPREFSLMPFWFWNDTLTDQELLRQVADFEAHGIYGFVVHPRIGLPKDQGWLSPVMRNW